MAVNHPLFLVGAAAWAMTLHRHNQPGSFQNCAGISGFGWPPSLSGNFDLENNGFETGQFCLFRLRKTTPTKAQRAILESSHPSITASPPHPADKRNPQFLDGY